MILLLLSTLAWPSTELCAQALSAKQATAAQGVLTTAFDRLLEGCDAPDGVLMSKTRTTQKLPVQGVLTSRFGWRKWPLDRTKRQHHSGVDIAAPSGTPVRSIASGRVTFADDDGGHGLTVRITHSDGAVTEYCHLSSIGVRLGTRVLQGERIGAVGSTGTSTGPHLHFGVKISGKAVNPLNHPVYAPSL